MYKTIEGLKWRRNLLLMRDPVGNARIANKLARRIRALGGTIDVASDTN